jgi:septation ring formation regulator EzrA
MSEAQQLERIEDKLTKIGEDLSAIKANQASDLQRFRQVDDRLAAAVAAQAAALELHAAGCEVKETMANLEKRIDAADNTAKGAWWAGGRIWAAMVAILVLADLGFKLVQAMRK